MPVCRKRRIPRRQTCVGDKNHRITLEDRNIQAPEAGSVDFAEKFENTIEVWASIETPRGKTFFDGVSTDISITHMIGINFDATVTANQTWIELANGNRLRILAAENLEERSEEMMLTCTDRGAKVASQA